MADQEVRHGLVVTIMDLAQLAGFKQLAIGTEKKPVP
jgi:biopolymer transport protein ExbD